MKYEPVLRRVFRRAVITAIALAVAPVGATAQSITTKLLREIDGLGDAVPFQSVTDGVVVSRALQFISDRESPTVVRVEGVRLSRVGRSGAGPGEYRTPLRLATIRDSLLVFEPGDGRVSRYAVSRTNAGTTTVERQPRSSGAFSTAVSVTSTGLFFVESLGDGDEQVTGRPLSETIIWRGTRPGPSTPVVTVVQPRGSTWSVPVRINGRSFTSAAQQPFVGRSLWAMSKTGQGMALLEQQTDERTGVSTVSMRFWNASGKSDGRCDWTEKLEPLSQAVFDREIVRSFSDPRITVRRADIERATMRPKWLPAYDRMTFASDGAVWLRTSTRYLSGADRYVRVSRDGSSRRPVQFNATVTVLDAADGVVLAAYADDETVSARLYSYIVPGGLR